MRKKVAAELLGKVRRLAEVAGGACSNDENYFAKGMDGDKWVAWIMMIPGHEVVFFDVQSRDTTGRALGDLSMQSVDRLLQLKWEAPKPISALDALARAAANAESIDNSGPGDVTIYDEITGNGITNAPLSRPKTHRVIHLESMSNVDERGA